MKPERWRRIEALFHAARERDPDARAAFLAEACSGDEELRGEIDSLLAEHERGGKTLESIAADLAVEWSGSALLKQDGDERLMNTPAVEVAAPRVPTSSLPPKTRLGPYEVLGAIGAGGMGEVYKARDTRLNRKVAIKIVHERFGAWFEREARAISSLNHPHVCTLYDVGPNYLVMELVEGETLAARLEKGKLPLQLVLRYGAEIADALAAAHAKGILHRDLKPGNVMITKSGVKVLDFGLAKTPEDETLTSSLGGMGTPAYMAPEQREGKKCDTRTDIYAFGLLLHEAATGKRVLTDRPLNLSDLPEKPAHIVARCLEADPEERWQSAADLKRELVWASKAGPEPAPPRRLPRIAAGGAVLLVLLAVWWTGRPTAPGSLENPLAQAQLSKSTAGRFFIFPPGKSSFSAGASPITAAIASISPDGTKLAFTATDNSGSVLLWVRRIDSLTAQPLDGTESAYLPFWSPDSRWIGFFADGKLRKIDTTGGPPQTLCNAPNGRGGAWSRDGVVLFAPNITGPLFRVGATGGEPVALTKLNPPQTSHQFPSFLPDGRHFVFFIQDTTGNSGIYTSTLDSGESTRVMAADTGAAYAPPGYLVFARDGTLLAQAFSAATLQLAGDPFPIGDKVGSDFANTPGFSVSQDGLLSYRMGSGKPGLQTAWYDRSGKMLEAVGRPGNYRGIDLSPDERQVAIHRHDGTGGDIWLIQTSTGSISRFTFDPSQENSSPVWSPDGTRIAFASFRNGKWGVYLKASNGTGGEDLLYETNATTIPMSWSPDGRAVLYVTLNQSRDMFMLPVSGERKPMQVVPTLFDESHGQVSPDGKWIAYISPETGRMEVYVRPFPAGEDKWQVSTAGGVWPRWRRDTKELFYVDKAVGGKLMSVEIRTNGTILQPGSPKALFDFNSIGALPHSFIYHTYAVSADGQRFLIPSPASSSAEETASPIVVILNWTASLKNK
jgi:serine/threonine protein kinase